MYQNIDLIKEGGNFYLILKINDEITLKRLVTESAIEALISKYRQVK